MTKSKISNKKPKVKDKLSTLEVQRIESWREAVELGLGDVSMLKTMTRGFKIKVDELIYEVMNQTIINDPVSTALYKLYEACLDRYERESRERILGSSDISTRVNSAKITKERVVE